MYATQPDGTDSCTVCIIGGGVSGLQCLRAVTRCGISAVLLDKQTELGGVWNVYTYSGLAVQVRREFYRLAEFDPPDDINMEEYPTGVSMAKYIRAYAEHFQLGQYCRLGCRVTKINAVGPRSDESRRTWEVTYTEGISSQGTREVKLAAKFVVVCTGLHSVPHIPDVQGRSSFQGTIIHSGQLNDLSVAAGKRVVVVGGGKAAHDTVVELAGSGMCSSVTAVYLHAHWPVSREPFPGVHICHLFNSRFAQRVLPAYYDAGPWQRAKHALLKPYRKWFWRRMEERMTWMHGLTGDAVPLMPMERDIFYGGIIHDGRWQPLLNSGKVATIKGELARYQPGGVQLSSGQQINCDLVVFATGYSKRYSFFDPETLSKLNIQRDGLYLYRNIIPPRVPNLAFIGSEVNSFNNPLTIALQCEWLRRALMGQLVLPHTQGMINDVEAQVDWKRQVMPPQLHRSAALLIHMQSYHDQLVRDMGEKPRRKKTYLQEHWEPYTVHDYDALFQWEGRGVTPGKTAGKISPETATPGARASATAEGKPKGGSSSSKGAAAGWRQAFAVCFLPAPPEGSRPPEGELAANTAPGEPEDPGSGTPRTTPQQPASPELLDTSQQRPSSVLRKLQRGLMMSEDSGSARRRTGSSRELLRRAATAQIEAMLTDANMLELVEASGISLNASVGAASSPSARLRLFIPPSPSMCDVQASGQEQQQQPRQQMQLPEAPPLLLHPPLSLPHLTQQSGADFEFCSNGSNLVSDSNLLTGSNRASVTTGAPPTPPLQRESGGSVSGSLGSSMTLSTVASRLKQAHAKLMRGLQQQPQSPEAVPPAAGSAAGSASGSAPGASCPLIRAQSEAAARAAMYNTLYCSPPGASGSITSARRALAAARSTSATASVDSGVFSTGLHRGSFEPLHLGDKPALPSRTDSATSQGAGGSSRLHNSSACSPTAQHHYYIMSTSPTHHAPAGLGTGPQAAAPAQPRRCSCVHARRASGSSSCRSSVGASGGCLPPAPVGPIAAAASARGGAGRCASCGGCLEHLTSEHVRVSCSSVASGGAAATAVSAFAAVAGDITAVAVSVPSPGGADADTGSPGAPGRSSMGRASSDLATRVNRYAAMMSGGTDEKLKAFAKSMKPTAAPCRSSSRNGSLSSIGGTPGGAAGKRPSVVLGSLNGSGENSANNSGNFAGAGGVPSKEGLAGTSTPQVRQSTSHMAIPATSTDGTGEYADIGRHGGGAATTTPPSATDRSVRGGFLSRVATTDRSVRGGSSSNAGSSFKLSASKSMAQLAAMWQ